MKMNGRLVRMVLMLVLVTLTMSQLVSAANGGNAGGGNVVKVRAAHDLGGKSATRTPFGGNGTRLNADVCSGWCTCSACGCNGSSSCCDAGCDACWDYRDGQGYCGAAQ
jgi:hypothetical protein